MAIFMVSALLLALILMREAVLKNEIEVKKDFPKIMKGGNKKMAEDEESDEDEEEEQEESKKKDKKEKDKEEPYSLGLDLRGSGLPDPDEYQKRAEKALGTMSFF